MHKYARLRERHPHHNTQDRSVPHGKQASVGIKDINSYEEKWNKIKMVSMTAMKIYLKKTYVDRLIREK